MLLMGNHPHPAVENLRQTEMEGFKLFPNLGCFRPICCVLGCTPLWLHTAVVALFCFPPADANATLWMQLLNSYRYVKLNGNIFYHLRTY